MHRIGHGLDSHRLEGGRTLTLGGLPIPEAERGAVAHSDGDALLHALADALLSALGLGDIGQLYPDSAPENAGLDSRDIVREVLRRVQAQGYRVVNVAGAVVLDRPKLGGLRTEMAGAVAALLGVDAGAVGLTFKTSEGLAPDHVQASVTVLLSRG